LRIFILSTLSYLLIERNLLDFELMPVYQVQDHVLVAIDLQADALAFANGTPPPPREHRAHHLDHVLQRKTLKVLAKQTSIMKRSDHLSKYLAGVWISLVSNWQMKDTWRLSMETSSVPVCLTYSWMNRLAF
jgi:hypothetical protein